YNVLFEPSGSLLTNAPYGAWRWPVREDAVTRGLLKFGPPQQLIRQGSHNQIAVSGDGKVLAIAHIGSGGLLLHADRPTQPMQLGPHADMRYVSVSSDGRWVATGSHNGRGLTVGDARTGK